MSRAPRAMRNASLLAFAIVALAGWWPAESTAAPAIPKGSGLDQSFGGRGVRVFRGVAGRNTAVELCELGQDGHLLVAGIGSNGRLGDGLDPGGGQVWISRLTASGKPLRKFGNNGMLERFPMKDVRVATLTSDARGRTLVVVVRKSGKRTYASLTRLSTTGRIDRGFGSRGSVALGRVTSTSTVEIIPANDRIFLATGRSGRLSIRSLTTDGAVDASFGGGTITPTDFDVFDAVPAPDGGLFLAGTQDITAEASRAIVRKLHSDGSPDTAWAANGEHRVEATPTSVSTDLNMTSPQAAPESLIAVDAIPMADGGLTVNLRTFGKSYSTSPSWAQRLLANGQLDTSYGTAGSRGLSFSFLTFDGGGGDYTRSFTTFAPDGRTFVGWYSDLDGKPSFGVRSFSANGALETAPGPAINIGRSQSWIVDQEVDGSAERVYGCGFSSRSRPYRAIGYVFAARTR